MENLVPYIYIVFIVLSVSFCVEDDSVVNIIFDHIEMSENVGDYFTYNYDVQKINATAFLVQMEVEQLVELDNKYSIEMEAYHSPENNGEYSLFMQLPREALCDFMKNAYKDYIYDGLKDYSNIPEPGTCPLPVEKYWIKDGIFDIGMYNGMANPGGWHMDLKLYEDDEVKIVTKLFTVVKEN